MALIFAAGCATIGVGISILYKKFKFIYVLWAFLLYWAAFTISHFANIPNTFLVRITFFPIPLGIMLICVASFITWFKKPKGRKLQEEDPSKNLHIKP